MGSFLCEKTKLCYFFADENGRKFYEILQIFDRRSGGCDSAHFRLSGQCTTAWRRGLARPPGRGLARTPRMAMGWASRRHRDWGSILGMGLSLCALWLRLLSLCLRAGLCTAGLSGARGSPPAAGRRQRRSQSGRVTDAAWAFVSRQWLVGGRRV